MNKKQLIYAVAKSAGLTQTAVKSTVDAFCEIVGDRLAEGKSVHIIGFGAFEVKARAARTGRDLRTNTSLAIPAAKAAAFRAGSLLKAAVRENRP